MHQYTCTYEIKYIALVLSLGYFLVRLCTVSVTKAGCLQEFRLVHLSQYLQNHQCQASVHCHCLPPPVQSEDVPQMIN